MSGFRTCSTCLSPASQATLLRMITIEARFPDRTLSVAFRILSPVTPLEENRAPMFQTASPMNYLSPNPRFHGPKGVESHKQNAGWYFKAAPVELAVLTRLASNRILRTGPVTDPM